MPSIVWPLTFLLSIASGFALSSSDISLPG
jgi:hypothetical protein